VTDLDALERYWRRTIQTPEAREGTLALIQRVRKAEAALELAQAANRLVAAKAYEAESQCGKWAERAGSAEAGEDTANMHLREARADAVRAKESLAANKIAYINQIRALQEDVAQLERVREAAQITILSLDSALNGGPAWTLPQFATWDGLIMLRAALAALEALK